MNTFDIAVGKCEAIDKSTVTIRLDSAIVSRLVPGHPWRTSGTSVLRLDIRLCSESRPPEIGRELFLQREALLRNPRASLDLLGDGQFAPIRLRAIGDNTDPEAMQPAAKAGRGDRSRVRWGKEG